LRKGRDDTGKKVAEKTRRVVCTKSLMGKKKRSSGKDHLEAEHHSEARTTTTRKVAKNNNRSGQWKGREVTCYKAKKKHFADERGSQDYGSS